MSSTVSATDFSPFSSEAVCWLPKTLNWSVSFSWSWTQEASLFDSARSQILSTANSATWHQKLLLQLRQQQQPFPIGHPLCIINDYCIALRCNQFTQWWLPGQLTLLAGMHFAVCRGNCSRRKILMRFTALPAAAVAAHKQDYRQGEGNREGGKAGNRKTVSAARLCKVRVWSGLTLLLCNIKLQCCNTTTVLVRPVTDRQKSSRAKECQLSSRQLSSHSGMWNECCCCCCYFCRAIKKEYSLVWRGMRKPCVWAKC